MSLLVWSGEKFTFHPIYAILCHTNHQITSHWHQYNTKITIIGKNLVILIQNLSKIR